jgi:hypothetical protein
VIWTVSLVMQPFTFSMVIADNALGLDASVTQSALEEALASRMQDGTIGSRMSVIGQAIRSRYLPKANR